MYESLQPEVFHELARLPLRLWQVQLLAERQFLADFLRRRCVCAKRGFPAVLLVFLAAGPGASCDSWQEQNSRHISSPAQIRYTTDKNVARLTWTLHLMASSRHGQSTPRRTTIKGERCVKACRGHRLTFPDSP